MYEGVVYEGVVYDPEVYVAARGPLGVVDRAPLLVLGGGGESKLERVSGPVYDPLDPVPDFDGDDGREPCPYPVVLERPVPNIGLDGRYPGVDVVRECPPLGLCDSKTARSSLSRPGGGSVLSALGSVDARECKPTPPKMAERRKLSGVESPTRPTLVLEKADEDGRDSSVRSVILLSRFLGSIDCVGGDRGENVGRETNDGDPVYVPEYVNVPVADANVGPPERGDPWDDHSVSACSVLSSSSSK